MFLHALPFALSFLMVPMVLAGAAWGEWWLALAPLYGSFVMSIADRLFGLDTENLNPAMEEAALFWHKLITWIWPVLQTGLIFATIAIAVNNPGLEPLHLFLVALGLSYATGTVGINYAHELMHQRNRWERFAGEYLMSQVLYGHFVTEHLYNHHKNVGTPGDPVTARYNENFWWFLPRVLWQSFASAWRIAGDMEARRKRARLGYRNPFWRYWGMGLAFVALAWLVGGWLGVWLYLGQAALAVMALEAVNYVEHYGLTRKYLGEGKYEHVKPRHSWNASHTATNRLLINLQRHSDHHYRPDRRFPLLQNYDEDDAPQLPFGYPDRKSVV